MLAGMIVRCATEADAAAIAAVHTASWRDAYAHILAPEFLSSSIETDRRTVWLQRLKDRPPSQLVDIAVDATGQVVAFVCGYCDFDPRWGSLIDNLHVLPKLRGQGIGARLFRTVVARLAATNSSSGLHLWIFEANVAGLRFYGRLGGRIVGKDRSRIPAAGGKAVLLVHWPNLAHIG
jgi:ribosomal protein S18 acetylase RimI-like enzyme